MSTQRSLLSRGKNQEKPDVSQRLYLNLTQNSAPSFITVNISSSDQPLGETPTETSRQRQPLKGLCSAQR